MRKKVGCEGGGENAAKPASNIGAVAGLSRGVARPVRKLRTKSAEKLFMEHLKFGHFCTPPLACGTRTHIAGECDLSSTFWLVGALEAHG